MYIIYLSKNFDGSYPPLQQVYDTFLRPGTLIFPEKFYDVFYPPDKRFYGFVTIEHDGTTVTSCEWDEEAYQAWCKANPEHPEPEPQATLDERVTNLEGDTAELHEALDMILTGVTE